MTLGNGGMLTVAQVANKLKVGERQVQRLCQFGKLRSMWSLQYYRHRGVDYCRWGWSIYPSGVKELLKGQKYPSRG